MNHPRRTHAPQCKNWPINSVNTLALSPRLVFHRQKPQIIMGKIMKTILKWALRIVVVAVLIVAVLAVWKREQLTRLMAVNSLFSQEKIVHNFSNMNAAFVSTPMSRGNTPVTLLPAGTPMTLPTDAAQWIKDRSVTALVVLKDGDLVFEDYYLGTTPEDQRISWSVAKSFLSSLMGILVAEGAIADINDPVIKYAPALKGSAYETATIRNVLQMQSGVTFDEDYLKFSSDINKMGRVLALGGSMDEFATSIKDSFVAPGTQWQYVSIDTHVIGMVIRGATNRSVIDLLQEKLLHPMGLEAPTYYVTDSNGVAFVLGGLNMRTRDYARFGQMFLQGGMWNGAQLVPADWVAESTTPSATTKDGATKYGYQWWMPSDAEEGEYFARGVYGQHIYINTRLNVVIASNAADRKFRESGVSSSIIAMFRAIAEAT